MKQIFLLCILLTSSSCAQSPIAGRDVSKNAYPYRDKSGKFGYVDDRLRTLIKPQYAHAEPFTEHGYAVITDSLGKKGIINKSNQLVMPAHYEYIQLYRLHDYTLAAVNSHYFTRWRFWEWKFLPGFNLMGTNTDGRLFDTKVKRIKKSVVVLGNKPRKIMGKNLTDKSFIQENYRIQALEDNQVIIDDHLFKIEPQKVRHIASNVKGPLDAETFAQQKKDRLHILDKQGKRISKKSFLQVDSIVFNLENEHIQLATDFSPSQPIMSAYQDATGAYFIYPNFSKTLPQIIQDNKFEEVPSTEEILRGLWLLASVPNSDYFLFMGYRDGKRYFRALDTQGNWHQTLPPNLLFTVVQNTGRILWPTQENFIPDQQIPEGWMVQEIIQVRENSLYEIRIVKNQEERQGIWDNDMKQWLFAPEYYAIYPMDNKMYWRYQSEKDGLWGVRDTESKVLIEPTYHRLQPDGWVTKRHDEGSISFYLHPQTLVELTEK